VYKPEISGKAPEGRYGHTANFLLE